MLEITDSDISCGVNQIIGVHGCTLGDFKEFVNRKPNWDQDNDYNIPLIYEDDCLEKGYTYLFSDNQTGHGEDVAKWIKKYKLGSLVSSRRVLNPNMRDRGNTKIKVWVWHYNGRKINAGKISKTSERAE